MASQLPSCPSVLRPRRQCLSPNCQWRRQECLNHTHAPVSAALASNSSDMLEGEAAQAAVAAAPVERWEGGVWLVLSHRHTRALLLHSRMLALSRHNAVVGRSSVLLVCTAATGREAVPRLLLTNALRAYPQRGLRALVHTDMNIGYKVRPSPLLATTPNEAVHTVFTCLLPTLLPRVVHSAARSSACSSPRTSGGASRGSSPATPTSTPPPPPSPA